MLGIGRFAVVPAEAELVTVAAQLAFSDVEKRPVDATFKQRNEALGGVTMHVPAGVFAWRYGRPFRGH